MNASGHVTHLIDRICRRFAQNHRFRQIWRNNRRQGQKNRPEGFPRIFGQKRIPAFCHHDRIDYKEFDVISLNAIGDGFNDFRGCQHTGLDGIGPDVGKN